MTLQTKLDFTDFILHNMIDKLRQLIYKNRLYIVLFIVVLILAMIWRMQVELIFGAAVFFAALAFALKREIIAKALKRVKRDIFKKKLQTILLVIILALMLMWKASYEAIALWMLFFSFLFYDWENRIIAGLALLSLASCPFLLIYKREDLAETMAIYAYYFLAMTVVLQIAELKRKPEETREIDAKQERETDTKFKTPSKTEF